MHTLFKLNSTVVFCWTRAHKLLGMADFEGEKIRQTLPKGIVAGVASVCWHFNQLLIIDLLYGSLYLCVSVYFISRRKVISLESITGSLKSE